MTFLDARLLRHIAGLRLYARAAMPSAADGDRRGTAAGSGMEYVDHREYQPGDDLRHVDVHAYARFGRAYVKRYAADRGLDLAILVDTSESMVHGTPSKLRHAAELATLLAYVGASAGDRVRVATFGHGGSLRWRPPIGSTEGLVGLVKDLQRRVSSPPGESDLVAVAKAGEAVLGPVGVTIVLSDWWTADPEAAVRAFARSGREVVAVQTVAPDEEDSRLLGDGRMRLVDAETGDRLDVPLNGPAHEAYERALAEWRTRLRDAVARYRGRYLVARTDRPVADIALNDWRTEGFLA